MDDQGRQQCAHCGLRVYFDETGLFKRWRHHGSNLAECQIFYAEPRVSQGTAREKNEQRARNLLREMALSEDEGRVKMISDALDVWFGKEEL